MRFRASHETSHSPRQKNQARRFGNRQPSIQSNSSRALRNQQPHDRSSQPPAYTRYRSRRSPCCCPNQNPRSEPVKSGDSAHRSPGLIGSMPGKSDHASMKVISSIIERKLFIDWAAPFLIFKFDVAPSKRLGFEKATVSNRHRGRVPYPERITRSNHIRSAVACEQSHGAIPTEQRVHGNWGHSLDRHPHLAYQNRRAPLPCNIWCSWALNTQRLPLLCLAQRNHWDCSCLGPETYPAGQLTYLEHLPRIRLTHPPSGTGYKSKTDKEKSILKPTHQSSTSIEPGLPILHNKMTNAVIKAKKLIGTHSHLNLKASAFELSESPFAPKSNTTRMLIHRPQPHRTQSVV